MLFSASYSWSLFSRHERTHHSLTPTRRNTCLTLLASALVSSSSCVRGPRADRPARDICVSLPVHSTRWGRLLHWLRGDTTAPDSAHAPTALPQP